MPATTTRATAEASTRLLPYVPRMLVDRAPTAPTHWSIPGTLVCADISGFTTLTERLSSAGRVGSEQLVDTLNDVYTALLTPTTDGGDVLRFSGDALLVFYDGDDHTQRAAHAAHGMQQALQRLGPVPAPGGAVRISMAVGIHRDTFDFYLTGSSHLELVVAGPAASTAVRLQDRATGRQTLVSSAAAEALQQARLDPVADEAFALAGVPDLPPIEAGTPAAVPDLERYVAPPLREFLCRSEREYEHRTAAVAFVGLRGTDATTTHSGRAGVFEHLQQTMSHIHDVCDEFGVVVISADLADDGINVMLAAGTPVATEDDARRMLHAARRIADASALADVRVGVNRGHVFGGDVGAPIRRTYSVMGDVVNVAARLMARAPDGGVLVHQAVVEHAGSFAHGTAQMLSLKGRAEPINAVVLGEPQAAGGGGGVNDGLPFVGREDELASAVALLNGTVAGGAALEIVGEAGIGKSRFVAEVLRHAAQHHVLTVACQPFGSARPYSVAASLIRQALGIARDATPDIAGRAVQVVMDEVAPETRRWAPLLAPVLDAHFDDVTEEDVAPQFRAAVITEVTLQLLRGVLRHPTIFLVEDTFWIDEASRDWLQQLLAHLDDRPWFVVTTRRTGSTWPEQDVRVTTMRLQPLSPHDGVALGRVAADTHPVSRARLRSLLDRANGNPMFLVELIRAEQSGIVHSDLPDTLEAIAQARLDSLPVSERAVVRHLSVLGAAFPRRLAEDYRAAAGIAPVPLQRLDDLLAVADPTMVRFRHEVYRTAAYEALPFRRRRQLHRVAGEAWEQHLGDRAIDEAGLLSLHFHHAGDWTRTWHYARAAAEHARSSAANADAADAYRRVLDAASHLESVDRTEVASVAEALGDVSELAGLFDAADEAYTRARRLSADSATHSRLLLKQGVLRERKGDYPGALRWYRRCINAAQQAPPTQRGHLLATAKVAYAGVRYRQGKLTDCAQWAHEAEELAQAAGDRVSLAHAYYLLDAAYTDLGRQPPAAYRELALPVFEEIGDFVRQGNVLNNLGIDAYYEGDWDAALSYYARSRDARERAGDLVGTAMSLNNMGEVLSDQGHHDEAVELFRQALQDWRWARYAVGEAVALSNLGRVSGRAGRREEGLALLRRAEALFAQIRSDVFVLDVRARIAELLIDMGRVVEGWDLAGDTLAALSKLGAERMYLPLLERCRGVALARTSSYELARTHLRRSLDGARAAGLVFEQALTMLALAELPDQPDPATRIEAERILTRLGCIQPGPPRTQQDGPDRLVGDRGRREEQGVQSTAGVANGS